MGTEDILLADPLDAVAPGTPAETATPLLIHVGYHKTATTWVQNVLFWPEAGYHRMMSQAEVFDGIARPGPFAFDPAPVRRAIAVRAAAMPPGGVAVISSELLCGNPFYGGREARDYAERLHRIAPDARILVTIREQVAMAASLYMQYLSRGGRLSAAAFFAGPPAPGYPAFDPVHLEFDRLVGHYRTLFGSGNVLVLTQESLRSGARGFAGAIAAFTGNPVSAPEALLARRAQGVSYPEYAVPVLRRLNHLRAGPAGRDPALDLGRAGETLYRGAGWLARRPLALRALGARRPVRDHLVRLYAGRFAESNRALAALCPALDLAGYQGIGGA